MISFSWGFSRFVIFVGPFAVKIARVRLLRPFIWLARQFQKGEAQEKTLRQLRNPRGAVNKVFFNGFIANRQEYAHWQATKHSALLPTYWSLLGLVNIQPRGKSITEEELLNEGPFGTRVKLVRDGYILDDWNNPANYCRWEGGIFMCDYGHSMETFMPLPQKMALSK